MINVSPLGLRQEQTRQKVTFCMFGHNNFKKHNFITDALAEAPQGNKHTKRGQRARRQPCIDHQVLVPRYRPILKERPDHKTSEKLERATARQRQSDTCNENSPSTTRQYKEKN